MDGQDGRLVGQTTELFVQLSCLSTPTSQLVKSSEFIYTSSNVWGQ